MLRVSRTLGSILLLIALSIFLVAQEDGCGSDENGEEADGTTPAAETEAPEDTDEAKSGYSEDDIEYKLAVIDEGGFVDPNDPSIDAYAAVLDRLETKCEEDRTLISDQAVRATQLLAEEGISVTALQALRGFDGSIPDEFPVLSCAEVGAAWIVLTVGQ
jgi:hypothetical protein